MYRDGKYKYHEYPCFYDCFQRVKSICGKRAWVRGFMVYQVRGFENGRVMHKPVHPVKISVMHQRHQWESKDKIQCTMLFDIRIEFGVFRNGRCSKYQGR